MTTLLASTGRQAVLHIEVPILQKSIQCSSKKKRITHCYPSVLAETMQAEEIRLPESQEDMQLFLLTLREDLITAKVCRE